MHYAAEDDLAFLTLPLPPPNVGIMGVCNHSRFNCFLILTQLAFILEETPGLS